MQLELLKYEPPQDRKTPKYLQLARLLEEWLAKHQLESGAKLPSDRRLARHLNVTTVTVNKALNLLVAKGMIVRVVGSGTFLRRGSVPDKKLRIGLVSHEPILEDNGFISTLLRELRRMKSMAGIDILQLIRKPEEYAGAVKEFNLDALIVIGAEKYFVPTLRQIGATGFPIVSIGMYWKELADLTFGTDHAAVAAQAVRLLVANGFKQIGIVSSRESERTVLISSTEERLRGYRQGIWQARLSANPDWEITYSWNKETELREQLYRLNRENALPQAFLVSDLHAVEPLFHFLSELKIAPPKIVTFDNNLRSELAAIPYFSLTQNIHDTVERAIRFIDAKIHGKLLPCHKPTAPKLETTCRSLCVP